MYLTSEQCSSLIQLAESKNQWSRIRGGSKTSYDTVTIQVQDVSIIDSLTKYCSDVLKVDLSPTKVAIIKYNVGDSIQRHVDSGSDFQDPHKFTRDAVYNINIRLNQNFSGGEFFLDDELYYKPIGEIYHYSSNVYHEVKKVTDGVRYVALISISYEDVLGTNKRNTLI